MGRGLKGLCALGVFVSIGCASDEGPPGRRPTAPIPPHADGVGPGTTDAGAPATAADAGARDGGGPSAPDATSGESCGNGLDDDLSGAVDDGCTCVPGATQPCFAGDPALAGVGACALGTQHCTEGVEYGTWEACTGSGAPSTDACDGLDNDCDGTLDPGCGCELGRTIPCYDGPAGTEGVGACRAGAITCRAADGGGTAWSTCAGVVKPITEACGDGVDNDCDGRADCADSECSAAPGCGTTPPPGPVTPPPAATPHGALHFRGFSYCTTAGGLASAPSLGFYTDCGASWGDGGDLTVDVAGTYRLCARMVSDRSSCIGAEECLDLAVPTAGSSVSVPRFGGYWANSACAAEARDWGGRTCGKIARLAADGSVAWEAELGCTPRFCGYFTPGIECHRGEDLNATF